MLEFVDLLLVPLQSTFCHHANIIRLQVLRHCAAPVHFVRIALERGHTDLK